MQREWVAWCFGLILVTAISASGKQRSYEELLEVTRKADESWSGKDVGPVGLEKIRLEEVKTWTRAEVVSLGRNFDFTFKESWSDVVLQRWGMLDHEAGLWCFLRYFEAHRKRKDIPRGPLHNDDTKTNVAACLLEVLIGWAEQDPKGAWKTLVEIDRDISRFGLLKEMTVDRLAILAEKVARADPEFALGEFWRGPSLVRSEMLQGMCRSLPAGYPWEKLMREVALSRKVDDPGVRAILGGALMGRWMEDDVKEAVKWYESLEGEAISQAFQRSINWSDNGGFGGFAYESISFSDPKVTASLAKAVSLWHSRAPAAARNWLRDHTDLLPEMMTLRPFSDWEPQQSREMRKTLVYCLNKMEREKLVGSLNWYVLKRLFNRSQRTWLKEIEELRVSDGLEAEILKKLEQDLDRW